MRVALVHYWLVSMRGGERVLEALCEMYPEADVFTHVYVPGRISPTIRRHRVRTTFIQRLPFAGRWYQRYLPLMPLALESLDLRDYDLVISNESGPAKGVLVAPHATHVCYCLTPMRYLWDMYHFYRSRAGPVTRLVMPWLTHYLRLWDVTSAERVDHFAAISSFVARRIEQCYRRPAEVIWPPVDTGLFRPGGPPGDYYLMVGQLVSYKRPDLAIEAFTRMNKPLVVIGEGDQERALRRRAGPTVTFLGAQPLSSLQEHYARCRALVFPGEEDFGIVPVEAMASGRPVIAFGRGGVRDTMRDGVTGLFFDAQTPEGVIEAVRRFEAQEQSYDPVVIASHARQFDRAVFKERMAVFVDTQLAAGRAEWAARAVPAARPS